MKSEWNKTDQGRQIVKGEEHLTIEKVSRRYSRRAVEERIRRQKKNTQKKAQSPQGKKKVQLKDPARLT